MDGSLSHSEDGLTVTFTPSARLDYSSRYQLVVGRGARRLRDGAELPSEVRAVFRVTDPPPLRVIAVTPSGENEGVLRTRRSSSPSPRASDAPSSTPTATGR